MSDTRKPVTGLIIAALAMLLMGTLAVVASVLVVGTLAALIAVGYKIFLFIISL